MATVKKLRHNARREGCELIGFLTNRLFRNLMNRKSHEAVINHTPGVMIEHIAAK